MELCGQYFSTELIDRIGETLEVEPSISRRSMSRQVCEWLDWRAANGKLKEVSCRKALLELDRRGLIELPEVDERHRFPERSAHPGALEGCVGEVECSLAELGQVEVVPVSSRYSKASGIWNDLMDRYHYLGSGPLCGAQIRYLVRSDRYGWLGALSFSAGTRRLKKRDEWIGWSERARYANLQRVVCNSRFLILPTVRVPNLASHVLSLSTGRLCDDWEERYGYSPVLVETFVDPVRFRGTCYAAANWERVGSTAGRSSAYPNGKVSTGKKQIYGYGLCADWRSILCTEPAEAFGDKPRPASFDDWAEEEFSSVEFYDVRLRKRLLTLARDFWAQPGALTPQACNGSEAKIRAAYRFFSNNQVDMQTLLKPHRESTLERIKAHSVVLAVQDTSTLNYTAHGSTEGLGPINTKKDKSKGLILHDTMAFDPEGTPLGLLDVQCWARDPRAAGKRARRKELPIEEKESMKWLNRYQVVAEAQALCPETTMVSVGDREADIYELFSMAMADPSGPKLLVRAERSRNRKVGEEGQGHLWEKMAGERVAGSYEIDVPAKTSVPARTAKLEVRFAKVTLKPPKRKSLAPVEVWAVYAREVDCPDNVKSPLEWMLLTTVEVSTFEDAVRIVTWYTRRWGIETYHRTLKSGCRIKDRRLGTADRLQACLAIDMVVAWRVLYLTMRARQTPSVPCDILLSEDEWKGLWVFATKTRPPAEAPPLIGAALMIGELGGFRKSRRYPYPGATAVWRGLQRLEDIALAYAAAEHVRRQRDGP
jgi:hypothetical protein